MMIYASKQDIVRAQANYLNNVRGGVDCVVPPWIAPCPRTPKPQAYIPDPWFPPRAMRGQAAQAIQWLVHRAG